MSGALIALAALPIALGLNAPNASATSAAGRRLLSLAIPSYSIELRGMNRYDKGTVYMYYSGMQGSGWRPICDDGLLQSESGIAFAKVRGRPAAMLRAQRVGA